MTESDFEPLLATLSCMDSAQLRALGSAVGFPSLLARASCLQRNLAHAFQGLAQNFKQAKVLAYF